MKTNYSSRLENIISNKKATVGIFGMGYVGMPLSLRFSEVGYKVIGFDIDEKKIGFLNKRKSIITKIIIIFFIKSYSRMSTQCCS